jgi:hypothetical protein
MIKCITLKRLLSGADGMEDMHTRFFQEDSWNYIPSRAKRTGTVKQFSHTSEKSCLFKELITSRCALLKSEHGWGGVKGQGEADNIPSSSTIPSLGTGQIALPS